MNYRIWWLFYLTKTLNDVFLCMRVQIIRPYSRICCPIISLKVQERVYVKWEVKRNFLLLLLLLLLFFFLFLMLLLLLLFLLIFVFCYCSCFCFVFWSNRAANGKPKQILFSCIINANKEYVLFKMEETHPCACSMIVSVSCMGTSYQWCLTFQNKKFHRKSTI